ncbi:hypothetical protein MRB53_014418 [Persea americana]|uniref:Uncharacterized protein n=1 Tax=Persea americana TaxID=3435 RepID=A0ACC2KB82_PERAE|nr:hypothetical protein MRB53_014418 [Persea americana]
MPKIIARGEACLGAISRWEKSPSFSAGDYEYVALIIEGKRLLIDIDIKSEFETARSTKNYKRSCNLCRPFSSASRTACTKPGALRLCRFVASPDAKIGRIERRRGLSFVKHVHVSLLQKTTGKGVGLVLRLQIGEIWAGDLGHCMPV